ncbi:MAG TPA: PepSY-associated TM helix domain-containing protein, partial [Xanthomonadales bacterium]|nr:PepSY-associated TM helix domain-containing protein [Xanthomonadales bacterium]
FLFIAGVTGSVLAFYYEFDALLNPGLFRVEQAGQAAARSPTELAQAVNAWDERIRIFYSPITATPSRATVAYVEPVDNPQTGDAFNVPYDEVFINPITAEVTGARLWGECCGRENVIPMMHKLHNRLFLPSSIGRPIWGTVALLWTIMAVIGLVLTWPAAKPKWQRWRQAWKLNRGLPLLPMLISLHRATGLWFWLMIIPLAASGAAIGLDKQLFVPVVNLFSASAPQVETQIEPSPMAPAGTDQPAISFDTAVGEAQQHMQLLGLQTEPSAISYDHEDGTYRIDFGNRDQAGLHFNSVYLAATDGTIMGDTVKGTYSLEDWASATRDRIHSGKIAGLPGRILVFLSGWAVALLSLTGVIVWWKRRRRSSGR